jgi:predicted regulator of Ras-like GTPase activity (Roadblock/LC7/MglB family)
MVASLPRLSSFKDRLDHVLDHAIRETGSMGMTIARRDGLPIAWRLRGGGDARLAAAMAASILGTVSAIAVQLDRGDVNDVVADCSRGKIVAVQAGDEAVVIAWYGLDANLGLVLIRLGAAAQRIAEALEAA